MNILWLSHFVPYPPAGGALQRAYHLLRAASENHRLHLIAFHQPQLTSDGLTMDERLEALNELCASVKVLQIPAEAGVARRFLSKVQSVLGPAPYDYVWLRSLQFAEHVAQAARTQAVDLIHVDTIGLWQHVPESAPCIPLVLDHHNIESELGYRRAKATNSRIMREVLSRDARKLRKVEQRASSRAAINITVSYDDAAVLSALAPDACIHVVPNGVDTEFWSPSPEGGQGLAFAGTLGWFANRDAVEFILTEIMPAVLADRPGTNLALIGRDPPPEAIAASSDPRITVTGFVPDVRPHLVKAAIVLCPIRIGGGTRLKVLDALSMQKPLVSTRIGVEGLGLTPEVHYLAAETAAEFRDQIGRLLDDGDLRRRLGGAGRQHVSMHYDWKIVGRALEDSYRVATAPASRIHAPVASPAQSTSNGPQ